MVAITYLILDNEPVAEIYIFYLYRAMFRFFAMVTSYLAPAIILSTVLKPPL